MFGPVRGRWKDGCRCGLRGWPPDGGAQRVFRERAAVECRAPAAEADVRHLRGAAVGWRTEGSGRCVVGAGRVLECRALCRGPEVPGRRAAGRVSGRCGPVRTVGRGEGRRGLSVPARPAWSRCRFRTGPVASPGRSPCSGVEPLFRRARHRVGADRWERRGSAWTLCSGGAGRISVRVAAVSGRAGRIPRTQGLPSSRAAPSGRGPMLRFRTLFVLFCSVPPRRNRRRLQIRGFAAREKRKSCFFIFTL